MKRKVLALVLVLCFFGVALSSCAIFQKSGLDTPAKKYLAARMELNKTMKSYLGYRVALPEAERMALTAKVYPYFERTDLALDAWSAALNGEGIIWAAEDDFLLAKRSLMTLLITEGIIKIEQ